VGCVGGRDFGVELVEEGLPVVGFVVGGWVFVQVPVGGGDAEFVVGVFLGGGRVGGVARRGFKRMSGFVVVGRVRGVRRLGWVVGFRGFGGIACGFVVVGRVGVVAVFSYGGSPLVW